MTISSAYSRRPSNDGVHVPANAPLIRALRDRDGYSQRQLADTAGVSRDTVLRAEKGKRVKRMLLVPVAHVLGLPVEWLIDDGEPDLLALPRDREWNPTAAREIGPLVRLPNGLLVRSCKLESQTYPGVFGRLKFYDLEQFRWDDRERAAEMLRRHTDVCRRVRSEHVVRNYICEPDHSGRYCVVVDEWVAGQTLQEKFQAAPPLNLGQIAHDLLLALQALHGVQVICRGLSPATVIVQSSGVAVLSDLELAKLIERTRTVRPPQGFARDRFLAHEVNEQGRTIGPPADFYSWAMTIAWLLGEKTLPVQEITVERLRAREAPDPIAKLLVECMRQNWTLRPQRVEDILPSVAKWMRSSGGKA